MGIIIGIDEAGLGPNLGPFVVTAVVWQVPRVPAECDLWSLLAEIVTADPKSRDGRVAISDSKQLFQPHFGLKRLERSALALLGAVEADTSSLRRLDEHLQGDAGKWDTYPWLREHDLRLPYATPCAEVTELSDRLRTGPVQLSCVRSCVMSAAEFNQRLERGNKSELVTSCHFQVLRSLPVAWDNEDVLIYSDKHGGRNRYAAALADHWDGAWVQTVSESAEQSIYRIGSTELRFEPRAEQHLPVASASIISKYLRELHMALFNRFWQALLPDLKPTQGYPLDARRFACEIESHRARLEIAPDRLWRRK